MKGIVRRLAAHLGVFFGVLAVLWLALSASVLIPNSAIHENIEKSAWHYGQVEGFPVHDGDKRYSIADNYADVILLNIAWQMGESERSPFAAAIDTQYYDGEELGVNTGLLYSVTKDAEPNNDYTRYWHGNAMFARLLLLFTDVSGMKAIGLAVAVAFALVVVAMLVRRDHADLAALFVVSLAAVRMWNISLSIEYQASFIVAFIMCALFLQVERRGDSWLPLLATAAGAMVAFFDFLTTETLSILLPLILVVAVRAKEGRLAPLRESAILLIRCGFCWLAAYGGAYVVKWALASAVTGVNEFAVALDAAAVRLGPSEETAMLLRPEESSAGPLSAVVANLATLFGGTERTQLGRALIGSGISLGVLAVMWLAFASKGPNREAAVLLVVLGAVVLVRFVVVGDHSYRHDFFTYRALAAMILALMAAVWINMPLSRKAGER